MMGKETKHKDRETEGEQEWEVTEKYIQIRICKKVYFVSVITRSFFHSLLRYVCKKMTQGLETLCSLIPVSH